MYDKIVEEYSQITGLNNIIRNTPQQKKNYNGLLKLWSVLALITIMIVLFLPNKYSISYELISYTALFLLFTLAIYIIHYGGKQRKKVYKSCGCNTYEQYKLIMLKQLLEKYKIHGDNEIDKIIIVTEKILASKNKNISWIYVLVAALALPYWTTLTQYQLSKSNYLGMAILTSIAIILCCYFRALLELFTQMFSTEKNRQEFFYNHLIKYKYELLVKQKQEQN
ncbi:hypothetical protein HB816_04955 [Listeria booriae]|uniref:hypothetical protein n=1 Tax=Listeria booriae TaxID=1552123 RepID=UPI00162A6409|nr:hypothetical protein [Listeria booriae]MBC1229802.1 hypothetical protein [Listeria booriae]